MRSFRVVLPAVIAAAVTAGVIAAQVVIGHGGTSGADLARLGSANVMTAIQPAVGTAPGHPTGSPAAGVTPANSPSAHASPSHKSSPKPTTRPTPPPAGSSVRDQLLAQINDLRAQHGLPPYTLLSGLDASAHAHNVKMMGSCGLSHQCPGEASLGDRISAQGVHWSTCGENIGWSGPHANSTSAIVAAAEALTQSMYDEQPPNDGHRRNLLSSAFHHIGIDVVRDSSGKVWLTQDFSN
ncbi:MAG TPA: CAP domain-containing protein [Micromonosporaceae bacterium]|nr:CAP domain-containing protein [Micromonosporaceae bacterium]